MNDRASPISRRAYARWPVSLAARLETGMAGTECRVVDISVGGARIEPAVEHPPETALLLDLLSYGRFPARIAWNSPHQTGLQFSVAAEQVAEALQAIALYSSPTAADSEGAADAAVPALRRPRAEPADTAPTSQLQTILGENRDLKATITELRAGMEQLAYNRRQAVQEALADHQEEVRLLQTTVAAMRETLEQISYDKTVAVEQVRVESHDEIAQLKDAVAALRAQLESQRIQHEDSVQAREREFAHERAQLTETIAVLRQRLERCGGQGNN